MPSLEGEAHGEDGAEEHRETEDEGEYNGVFAFDVQRRREICEGTIFSEHMFPTYLFGH